MDKRYKYNGDAVIKLANYKSQAWE